MASSNARHDPSSHPHDPNVSTLAIHLVSCHPANETTTIIPIFRGTYLMLLLRQIILMLHQHQHIIMIIMSVIAPPRPCQLMINGATLNAHRITTATILLIISPPLPTPSDPTTLLLPIAVTTTRRRRRIINNNNTMDGPLIHSYRHHRPPGNVHR